MRESGETLTRKRGATIIFLATNNKIKKRHQEAPSFGFFSPPPKKRSRVKKMFETFFTFFVAYMFSESPFWGTRSWKNKKKPLIFLRMKKNKENSLHRRNLSKKLVPTLPFFVSFLESDKFLDSNNLTILLQIII